MPRNFFWRSADLKQSVNKKHSIYIDSAASSGGQGNVASLGLRLRQHCQFLNLVKKSLLYELSKEGFTISAES